MHGWSTRVRQVLVGTYTKHGPSSHDSLRFFHVSLGIQESLSPASSLVKYLFGRRVTHVNKKIPKTPDTRDTHRCCCVVYSRNKRGTSHACVGAATYWTIH
jgi:hypothetical protein